MFGAPSMPSATSRRCSYGPGIGAWNGGDEVEMCGIAKIGRSIRRITAVFSTGRSTMFRFSFNPGFPCIRTKTYLARSMPPSQISEAARPEIVTIANIRPAFRASVRATL